MPYHNSEQEEAAFIESKEGLKNYLSKAPKNIAKLFKSVDSKIQKEVNNGINCLFFLINKKKNIGLFTSSLTDENKIYELNNKLEARKNFKLFLPQILQICHNYGFDCAIKDKENNQTMTNFKPDGDDDSDDFWKEKTPS